MVFGAADVCDRHVGSGCRVVIFTAKPLRNLAVAAASARRQTFGQNFGRRRYPNNCQIGVSAAQRVNHGSRYVGDHGAVGADIVIDRAGQCVAMAMRLPIHRKLAAAARLPESLSAHLLISFENRCFARDDAARKYDIAVLTAVRLRQADQRALPAAAGEPPGSAGRVRSRRD